MPLFEKKDKKDRKSRNFLKGEGNIRVPGGRQMWGNFLGTLLVLLLIVLGYSLIVENREKTPTISLSELSADIQAGEVKKILVQGEKIEIEYAEEEKKKAQKEVESSLSETLKNYGVTPQELSAVEVTVQNPTGIGYWILNLAPFIVPLLFILFFLWFISRQVKGAGMQAFSFGQSKARIIDPDDKSQRVTFKDIAGVKEAKEEVAEIVDFLKNPKKFLEIGARIPKGVLLMGAAGTGKTLLARAVAGEAQVPFFSISGSEFVEMFVGVGASVTGDTPVLVRDESGVHLAPIAEVVDSYYREGEADTVKKVHSLQTLGFKPLLSGFRGETKEKMFFGGSRWSDVSHVFRHKVSKIFRIKYRGGELRTTGDHSVFVRERNMIRAKRADELHVGDVLVNLPFRVRGAFMKGVGTSHATRGHAFEEMPKPLILDVYGAEEERLREAYRYARATTYSSYAVSHELGVSPTTVMNWRSGKHQPKFLLSQTVARTPSRVVVTEELMRLFGYYAAEGDATPSYVRLTFGLHEEDLHDDVVSLFKFIFNQEVRRESNPQTNSMRLIVSSRPIADFFKRHVGTGSHRKHIPAFLWTLPKRYFLAYLDGYARGDGYTTKDGKLSITSVSKQHIRELAWLSSMHGIPVGVRETFAPAGRVIGNGKPLPETHSWNLIIGKTAHPFSAFMGTSNQAKRPIIEKVTIEPHDGYVYDFCGCEGEAFFGGEKPVLLHNSRVRDLFKLAKKAAPAIIFIDEIDAVGRVRGAGVGGGNDEREQTLNQILVEMDGFEPNEKVIIMAATNRPDVLDPALLRPGRFDRRVILDLPDVHDREEILTIHGRKKPFAEDVNLKVIAQRTPGFSGADLYSLMNEGAILAAREDRKKVSQYDLIRSIEKVMLGPERKSHLLSKKEKKITAYHEAGHALIASVFPHADPVHKISIVARGHAGGYTLKLPFEEKKLQSRKEFLDDIAVSLGGYVAEQMIFGDVTTGPANDLQVASALARDMVTKYGMSSQFGPVAVESLGGRLLPGVMDFGRKDYSEDVSAKIDSEVSLIIKNALKLVEEELTLHRNALDAIADELVRVETLERQEFEMILIANGIMPKKENEENGNNGKAEV